MNHFLILALFCWTTVGSAAVHLDIPYATFPDQDQNLTSLDIAAPADAQDLPVLIYVHGGGWWAGDKSNVGSKHTFFTDAGYVFVSINYRLTPQVPFPTHAQDVARAVAWVREHIADYGGDPERLTLFGHSAGAHLVAVVASDPRYLNEQGLTLAALEAAVLNDSAAYDMVDRAERGGGQLFEIYADTFGQDPDLWLAGSPIRHIAMEHNTPPMAILYSRGQNPDGVNPRREEIARDFAARLHREGVMAEVIDGSAYTHGEINALFGVEGNPMGPLVLDFLDRVSVFTRLEWSVDLPVGSADADGAPLDGTEVLFVTGHDGRLFAGNGYWNDDMGDQAIPGAQILVKDAPDQPWRVEHTFPDHVRVGGLQRVTLTTDHTGAALDEPVSLLLASPQGRIAEASVWVRDDATGTWVETIVAADPSEPVQNFARAMADHVDAVTGIHHVFACIATSALYRGAYAPDAPGKLVWADAPELTGSERMHAACVANGNLFVSVGTNGDPTDRDGGLFRRRHGPDADFDADHPRWELLWEWPRDGHPGLRGLTAVPDPEGGTHEVILGTLEGPGHIMRIDPVGLTATVEFDFKQHFLDAWGELGGSATLAAYNDMLPVVDPRSGRPGHLIGLFINHPLVDTAPYNGAWFLVRDHAGGYAWGGVIDHRQVPEDRLRSVRSFALTPFADDAGLLYAGGFDGAGGPWNETAWLYSGSLPAAELPRHRRIDLGVQNGAGAVPTKAVGNPGARLSPIGDEGGVHAFPGLDPGESHGISLSLPIVQVMGDG